VRNRMREICTSGSVGGEGGNILTYPANDQQALTPIPDFTSFIRASVTGLDKSIPFASSNRRGLASVRDRHAAVA
jgi:hypothetical protein